MKNDRLLDLPFSQEISQAHDTIRSLIKWLEAELIRQSRDGLDATGPVLGPFRVLSRLLTEHFDYEERTGFFSTSERLLPDSKDTVERLVLQHRGFRERMHAIEGGLEEAAKRHHASGSPTFEALVQEIRCLFQDLRAHDVEETRLLHELSEHRGR